VVHLRVVAPSEQAGKAHALLCESQVACHVVHLEGVTSDPDGDLLLADVPREEASVLVADLKELGIHESGSISIAPIEVQLSALAEQAERDAPGAPADAVVWEQVEAQTSEQSRLSWSFVGFMVLAALIAGVGIFQDSPILIVGAMVVGPEFGPIAAFCVAVVERRPRLALKSISALVVGLPVAIIAVWLATLAFRAIGVAPGTFGEQDHGLAASISDPGFFAFFVAFCAGTAGVLSLTSEKSGALIGVLVSVTTIPAAANIGLSFAYQDWTSLRGSAAQLALNVAAILLAGVSTLLVQRLLYRRRRVKHLGDEERARAGLPVGRSARTTETSPATTRSRASS
jgi:uncharacterized hydrophobic protein (TIGR00271 family)